MTVLALGGLDGTNPMAFLAALGVLVGGDPSWKLAWREEDLTPTLSGPASIEQLVDLLMDNKNRWGQEGLLAQSQVADLKVQPGVFRQLATTFLAEPKEKWPMGIWMLSSLGNELAVDGSKGNVKPTIFDFTSGTQSLLSSAQELRQAVTADHLYAALTGPWKREDSVKTFRWDSGTFREYALRQKDPSGDGATNTTEAGAEWLAFIGLSLIIGAPRRRRLYTTGAGGTWKTGWFTWPLWKPLASREEIAALLTHPDGQHATTEQMAARGIIGYFRSDIRRPKYGNFAPSKPISAS